jgi:hypothetical protein
VGDHGSFRKVVSFKALREVAMWRISTGLALLLVTIGLCDAQPIEHPRGQQYVYFAPGTFAPETAASISFGGGAEWMLRGGFALGVDGAYVTLPECLDCGVGLISVDASYHFFPHDPSSRVVPFVTGGYTLAFRSGTANLVNFGGGFNYWFNRGMGVRVEVRDHVHPSYWDAHWLAFRIGLAFR